MKKEINKEKSGEKGTREDGEGPLEEDALDVALLDAELEEVLAGHVGLELRVKRVCL